MWSKTFKHIKFFFLLFSAGINAEYQITVLATYISNFGGFGEWSFSALYESDNESILFDTGFHEDTVLHNAEILGKDLSKLRKSFKDINTDSFSKVYVARGFLDQRYKKDGTKEGPGNFDDSLEFKKVAEEEGIKFIILDDYKMVAKNIYATGTVDRKIEYYNGPKGLYIDKEFKVPDIIKDDQSVGMLTDKGWIMMSGCGHSGIINTAKKLQEI